MGEFNRTKEKKDMMDEKHNAVKNQLIEQLEKTPIVQIVCQKSQISRATFYRWKKEDEDFCSKADKAMCEGKKLINDYAESQVIAAIKEGNLTAAFYWLNHNHKSYANKLHLAGEVKTTISRKLSPEEQKSIKKALELLRLPRISSNNKNKSKKYGIKHKSNNRKSSNKKGSIL